MAKQNSGPPPIHPWQQQQAHNIVSRTSMDEVAVAASIQKALNAVPDGLFRFKVTYTPDQPRAAEPRPQPAAEPGEGNVHKRRRPDEIIEADCRGSSCFSQLYYDPATKEVVAVFRDKNQTTESYEMGRRAALEWFNAQSLGGFFNEEVR